MLYVSLVFHTPGLLPGVVRQAHNLSTTFLLLLGCLGPSWDQFHMETPTNRSTTNAAQLGLGAAAAGTLPSSMPACLSTSALHPHLKTVSGKWRGTKMLGGCPNNWSL